MDIYTERQKALRAILLNDPGKDILLKSLGFDWKDSSELDYLAWTDFKHLYFNTAKIERQLAGSPVTNGATRGLILHECLHNLWLHDVRSKDRKFPNAWKLACEYAINYYITVHVFAVTNWVMADPAWITALNGLIPGPTTVSAMMEQKIPFTTEGFYSYLTKDEKIQNDKAHENTLNRGKCKCSHTQEESPLEEVPIEDLLQQVKNTGGDIFIEGEKEDILRNLLNLQEQESMDVPWDQLLLGGLEDSIEMEYTYSRPNRRNEELPSYQPEKLLSFCWVLDVSPSITDEMKGSFISTLQAGIDRYRDSTHRVIFFAEGIVKDITVSPGTDISNIELPEEWGTDLTEVWNVLEEDKPDYALVLTDLEMFPVPEPSHTQIVWGVVNNIRIFNPDYGRVIELS